jgi:hypothetical protein
LITVLSSISADIISKGHSICIIGYCAMPWGNIWCTGSSIMMLVNSSFSIEPVPSDTSLVFVLSITGPNNGNTNDTIPIMGSAWIDRGPYQPLDFGYYQVFYRAEDDTNWLPASDTCIDEVRYDTLCYWNTDGLNPGNYIIRLVLKDNAGDSVDCLKLITLYETGIFSSDGNVFSSLKITPNPFSDFIKIESADFSEDSKLYFKIYDINGRVVLENESVNNVLDTRNLTKGVYFVCIDSDNKKIIKKIVKIK